MEVVVAVPVKPFDAAKARLSSLLPPSTRRRLGRLLALRTLSTARAAGALPLLLAADAEVAALAKAAGVEVVRDDGSSLSEAANRAVAWATGRGAGWIVCHADLPLLTAADLEWAVGLVAGGRTVLAPSADGGTSLAGSPGPSVELSYGPGSFRRHLAGAAGLDPVILTGIAYQLDLDRPADLSAAAAHPDGRWLADVVADTLPA